MGKITEQDNNHRCCHQGQRWVFVPTQGFNKKFQKDIIQPHASHGHHKIAHQLNAPPQVRALKHHVHAQVKTNGKRNEKRHDKCGHVWLKGKEAYMHHLLVKNVVVKNMVKKNIEEGVAAATGCVMVGLQRHKTAEERIKNVQHCKDGFPRLVVNLAHELQMYCAIFFSD